MPRFLPSVLSTGFLPVAELYAAARDGDLVKFDDVFICVDEPDRRELRASTLASELPRLPAARHLVAIGWSAAWIYGAIDDPPWQHEVCVRADERATLRLPPRFHSRELRLADSDETRIAGLRVTTPARTVRDLELKRTDSPGSRDAIARLAGMAGGENQPPLTR